VRVLLDELSALRRGTTLDPGGLEAAYATPAGPWLRVNMVSTLDGAAAGADGRTGSINNAADHRVFHLLRSTADAIVVGAGTARTEGYGEAAAPIVVVSRRGVLPDRLRSATPGTVLLATCRGAHGLAESRAVLGEEHVLVTGEDEVDLPALRAALHGRGLVRLLGEGGPSLLRALLAAGVVDELCATVVPRLVAGGSGRITAGPPLDVPARLGLLLEEDGTLLGRWLLCDPHDLRLRG
jgi:riboflavin biosynthesis pyrimidine reductase